MPVAMNNKKTRQDQRKKWEVICGKKSDEYFLLLERSSMAKAAAAGFWTRQVYLPKLFQ